MDNVASCSPDFEPVPYEPSPIEEAQAVEILNQGKPGHELDGHPVIDDEDAGREAAWAADRVRAEAYADWVAEQAEEEARERRILGRSGVTAESEDGDDLESEVG